MCSITQLVFFVTLGKVNTQRAGAGVAARWGQERRIFVVGKKMVVYAVGCFKQERHLARRSKEGVRCWKVRD
jgi:hypothetical protein